MVRERGMEKKDRSVVESVAIKTEHQRSQKLRRGGKEGETEGV